MTGPAPTAAAKGFCLCHTCGKLSRGNIPEPGFTLLCPRCGAALDPRKPDSLARSWALVITAALLYIPSMVFPIMQVEQMGVTIPTTVLVGVRELVVQGMWPLAIIVFMASIVIPVLKILSLSLLLTSMGVRSSWRPRQRTKLYRAVEFIGRWSMLDIFMISLLAALVRLGFFATFTPSKGAVFFAGVVLFTMAASKSLDPRLIWDRQKGIKKND